MMSGVSLERDVNDAEKPNNGPAAMNAKRINPQMEAMRAKNPNRIIPPITILNKCMLNSSDKEFILRFKMPSVIKNAAAMALINSNLVDPTFVVNLFIPKIELHIDLTRRLCITLPTGLQVRATFSINSKLRAPIVFLPGFTDITFTSAIVESPFCIINNDLQSNVQQH